MAAYKAFGGTRSVTRMWDEGEANSVDVLACADAPNPGYTTYSTVSLHAAPNLLDDRNTPVELAGVARTSVEAFINLIATTAFFVIKDGWLAAPGVVFPDLVAAYGLSPRLHHVLLVPPFPWPELGSVQVADGSSVHWLTCVPISESERQLLLAIGFDRFEAELERHDVAWFDLDRASIGEA